MTPDEFASIKPGPPITEEQMDAVQRLIDEAEAAGLARSMPTLAECMAIAAQRHEEVRT